MKLQYTPDPAGHAWQLTAEGLPMNIHERSDFWRAHLDDGEYREMTVVSSRQNPPAIQRNAKETVVTYSTLTAENGNVYDIALTIHIQESDGGLLFFATIDNHSPVRFNEIQLPFFDFDRLCSSPEEEVLYLPNGMGERIVNPRDFVRKSCHTEYMAADYCNIWQSNVYPAPLSMCWFGVQSGGYFLYLARKDDRFRICSLNVGTTPRNEEERLLLTVSQYPFARTGETITTPAVFVKLFKGDWRSGAADYKEWVQTWYTPVEKPQWVRNMAGWQRIIMKHQYGEIFFRYADLPQIYKDGAELGLHTLLVFGWWKGRFDNGYPQYEADEALGGERGLQDAIQEIQALGGRVILYSNGKLIDVKSTYYQEKGARSCQMDIDGNEYREHYRFSNNGTVLRNFGYKTFVSGCHAAEDWKQQLLDTTNTLLSFHPDATFYDQIGGCLTRLCFRETHKHGFRPDEEAVYRLENIKALRSALASEQAMGTEHLTDVFSAQFDFIHGCSVGSFYAPQAYPQMFRSLFPELIVSDRFLHDDREGMEDHLNYAFVMGLIFDASIYRGRKTHITALPRYAEYLTGLLDLKETYRRFFYEGTFVSEEDVALPEGVVMGAYRSQGDRLYAFANRRDQAVRFSFKNREITMEAHRVACAVFEKTV